MAKILVVDDDLVIVKLLVSFLEKEGHEVGSLLHPNEVIPVIQRWRPDLILLDYQMPEATGSDVLKWLRESEVGQDIPVVFLSGVPMYGMLGGLPAASDIRYLSKPLQVDHLRSALRQLLPSGPERSNS